MSEINLYHGDCMAAMAQMPDKCYELAIIDPPYGIGMNGGKSIGLRKKWKTSYNSVKHKQCEWDNKIPDPEYFDEIKRVSKNFIIWGGNYFSKHFNSIKHLIVWDKACEGTDFSHFEIAFTSFAGSNKKITIPIQVESQIRIHPTQKPIQLYKWLLANYAKPGDKILDTHGGSMSIAIACHDMGFDLDLWEIDKDYYDAGVKRFNLHKSQLQIQFA